MTFVPTKGKKASLHLPETDTFIDVEILEVKRAGRFVRVRSVLTNQEYDCSAEFLEPPMDSGVNERFKFFEKLTRLVVNKNINSLLVTGEGGIGKDFTINSILESEELVEEIDYVRVKGHCTPLALYQLLQDNADKLVIFSDCDSVLEDSTSANILKGVLDSYDNRMVKWLSSRGRSSANSFEFSGSAIFLSNKPKDSIDGALLSRSVILDLYMTATEKIERMEFILPTLSCCPNLSPEQKMAVLKILDKYKNTVQNLNLRTLIKGLQVYDQTADLDLVRYQILNG